MFDLGFWIFFYLVTGGCRMGWVYALPSYERPIWLLRPAWYKNAVLILLWPLHIITNFLANGLYSKHAIIREIKSEIQFFATMGLIFFVAAAAYYIAGQVTEIVWIKILIAVPMMFLIQKIAAVIIPAGQ